MILRNLFRLKNKLYLFPLLAIFYFHISYCVIAKESTDIGFKSLIHNENFNSDIVKITGDSIFSRGNNEVRKMQDVCIAKHAFNWSNIPNNDNYYCYQHNFDKFCGLPINRFMSKDKKSFKDNNNCELENEDIHLNLKANLTEGPCPQYKDFNMKNNNTKVVFDDTTQSNSLEDIHKVTIEKEITSKKENKVSESDLGTNNDEKKEPQIAPFDEWTKEKLKMNVESNHHKVNNVDIENVSIVSANKQGSTNKQLPLVTTKRNYASKECGAKVLLSNDEAEFKSAILNDKERDVYMRNPCEKAQQKFAVIELCETIVPTGIELANFELFSSGPKEFKVSVSERFPTTEWHQIGQFEMINNRDIQKFDLIKTGLYVKYAKIELTSHWGKEHYCTLSMVRVFGISMVEEYEAEASVVNIPATPTPVISSVSNQTLESTTSQSKELVDKKINKVSNDDGSVKTLVDKVVNAVGSKIESIINTVMKNNKATKSFMKSESLTLEEQCTKCLVNHESAYSYELCYFYNYVIRIISRRNIVKNTNKNKMVISHPPSITLIRKNREFSKYVKMKKRQRRKLIFQKYLIEKLKKEEEFSSIEKKIIIQNGGDHSLPAANMNYKESVFLKLNKRLSNLELNISLTSEYLSELSKRYVSQTSDNMKMHESTIKKSEDLIKRLMIDLRFEIDQQINSMKGEISSFKKSIKNSHKMVHYDSSLSVTKPPEIVNGDCPSGRHMLNNGNDKIWTTEQVLFVVVGTQFITIICIFLLQWLFSWLYAKKEQSAKEEEIGNIRNEIEMLKNIVLEENDEETKEIVKEVEGTQPIVLKKKRRKRKKTVLPDNDWDSALDNPSLPSETPTPSELSIETDRIPLTLCNENVPCQQKNSLLLTADGFQIHSNRKNSKLRKINASLIINA